MAVLAAVENIFPPIPADVLVAFGGFLAARSDASPWPAFLAVWIGNVSGAMLMYFAGRRMGRAWITRRLHLAPGSPNEERLTRWHARYGAAALFASRFVPGLRAVVPPLAGALRFRIGPLFVAISLASGLWYGLITWLAFSTGNNWEVLSTRVSALGKWSGVLAATLVALGAVAWFIARRRRRGGVS